MVSLQTLMQFIDIFSIIAHKMTFNEKLSDLEIRFLQIIEEYDFILDYLKKED